MSVQFFLPSWQKCYLHQLTRLGNSEGQLDFFLSHLVKLRFLDVLGFRNCHKQKNVDNEMSCTKTILLNSPKHCTLCTLKLALEELNPAIKSKMKHFCENIPFTYLFVSGGKKCSFFGIFDVLCFLGTPVLRFALLPYYRRYTLMPFTWT